jgi:hypothetical protein
MQKQNFINALGIALIFLLIVTLRMAQGIQLDEHTVALYLFDEKKGKEVMDSSLNENHGEIMGEVDWAEGKFDGALSFSGSNAFVEIPSSESLDITDELTIEMWLYLRNYSSAGGTGVTKETSYKLGPRNDKKIVFRITSENQAWGQAFIASKTDIPLKEWHHIAGTYDAKSGEMKVYFDGEEDGDGKLKGKIVPNASVVWLGRGNSPFLDGLLDEVRISNVIRQKSEIKELMLGFTFPVPLFNTLSATWGNIKYR